MKDVLEELLAMGNEVVTRCHGMNRKLCCWVQGGFNNSILWYKHGIHVPLLQHKTCLPSWLILSTETTLFMQFGGRLAIIKLQIFSKNRCHFSCQAETDWNSICINQQYQDLLMCSYLSQVTLASHGLGPSCSDNMTDTYKWICLGKCKRCQTIV